MKNPRLSFLAVILGTWLFTGDALAQDPTIATCKLMSRPPATNE